MKTSCCHSNEIYHDKEYWMCANVICENYMRPTQVIYHRYWNNLFLAFFFVFFFIFTYNDFSYNTQQPAVIDFTKNHLKISKALTEENLRAELDANHIICPEQVYAQIMIESGHLSSYLTKRTNNLLGMRFPLRRKSCAVGVFLPAENLIIKGTRSEVKKYCAKNNYAVFENWEDCIRDYKYWQQESFKLTDLYLTFLGNYYAEDSNYVSKIKEITR